MPMKALKWFFWQLAHANLLLAFSTAGAVYLVQLVLGLPQDPNPILILFLVTFAIYNFNRHTDKEEDQINHPERVAFISKYGKALAVLSLFAYITAIILSLYGGRGAQLLVMLPLVAVMLYSLRWFPKNSGTIKRLKELFITKNFVVSGAWTTTVVFLPIFYSEQGITMLSLILFTFFFIRLFINTVVFDMRDVFGDRKREVHSLPVMLGYNYSRKLMIALNLFTLTFTAILPVIGAVPEMFYLFTVSVLYGQVYLLLSASKKNLRFLCDVIVDGEFSVLAIIVMVSQGLM